MNKKILAILLALVMILAACGGSTEPAEETSPVDDATTSEDTTETGEETTPASDLNVGVFYYDYSDVYISTVRAELDKMLEAEGIKYTNYDAAATQPTQTDQVTSAITAGANLLVVNVVETSSVDAAQGIADQAKAADIPVIFFNREVDDSVIKSYEKAAFIGTNAPEAGHMQGEMIGEYLLANYDTVDLNKDGTISYVMFKGQEGNAEAEARTQFAVEDADKLLTEGGKNALAFYDANNTQKYLVDTQGQWSAAAANDYMQTILSSYSEANGNMVELVIANNDGMAEGAISALQNAGYNKEGSTVIPVFGVDATETAVAKIDAGEMVGSIKQDNVGMAETITTLVKNVKEGAELMANTDSYNVDEGVAKIRVPYSKYTAN